MTQLGERLRTAREMRGLSLAEAATATRILPRYIQALENGDFASLPGDVYARGFIRNYAQLLDLPAEELIFLYRQERGEPTGKITVMPAAAPPRTRSCLVPSISFFGAFFVVLMLVALAYFAAESLGLFTRREVLASSTPTRVIPTPTEFPTATEGPSTPTVPPSVRTPDVASTAVAPPPGPAETATPAPPTVTPTPSQTVVAVTVLRQPGSIGSWMTVAVDGVPTFDQLLRGGESRDWPVNREIFLNIGDTSVVVLAVNGQNCPGFPGTVRGVARRVTITNACP